MGMQTKWLSWNEIIPYKEELVNLEYELIKEFHYPDREISMDYPSKSVENLKNYLESGTTFFWAALDNTKLAGYYWAYVSEFLGKKRWVLRSLIVKDEYKGLGLGKLAVQEGLIKAKEQGCFDAVTEYVPFNDKAGYLYEKAGYKISRIEVVKNLE